MESADLIPLLEQLDDNVDELEEVLAPILGSTVIDTSKKLPVLDKAKFNVMITYALESLIFSYLRLHGVNAKEHSIFRELTRVKQYFKKITMLETEPEKRTLAVDKQAAGRFIKHGLAGNDKLDLQREEQLAKEKARAQLKASILAKKAGGTPEVSSQNASSESGSEAHPNADLEGAAEETRTLSTLGSFEASAGNQQKVKKSKTESGDANEAKHKKRRNKEDRRELRKHRRNKKEESRKVRKAA